jgi:hypothetical protein
MSPEQLRRAPAGGTHANPLRSYRIMAQEAGPTKAELANRIDDIENLLEEALDPGCRGRRNRSGERLGIGSR